MAATDLSPDEFAAAVAAVTSAFGDPTRREIYLFARISADGVKAAEVAERFGLHPNVARHHLEKLASGGYLDVALVRHETAGRPSKRYRAGLADTNLSFPPRRDDLLGMLLARALDRLPRADAARLADEVGYEYGRALAARIEPTEGRRSLKHALAAVADALTAHGFAAHADAGRGALRIVAEHCPFGDAAQQYPHVLCAIDSGMVRGMLEGLCGAPQPTVALEERRPDGDEHCVTSV